MNASAKAISAAVGLSFFAALASSSVAWAQDLKHPRAMGLAKPAFERPDPDKLRITLSNGLVAYVAQDKRAPLTSITAYLGLGSAHGAPGEADALAAALRRGPAGLPTGEFLAQLKAMNAIYTVTQRPEETEIYLDVPAKDTELALQLLARVLSDPAFASTATNRAAPRAVVGGIDYSYSLVGAVSLFETELYGGHHLGRQPSYQEMNAAQSQGAQRLHKEFVRAENLTLALAGDFASSAAQKSLRQAFATIAKGSPDKGAALAAVAPRKERRLVLEEADRDQGWIVMGHELPQVPLADEAALHVMDYILGAFHLDSRLYRSSRELRGLTNDNSTFLKPGVNGPGSYSLRTYGRPEAVRLLVDVSFEQLRLIRETSVSEEELFVAKGALVDGLYAERYATGIDATQAYALEWLRRGNHSESQSYSSRIAEVSVSDVQAAAQKYLHPDRMIVVVVGPQARISAVPAIESEPQLNTWGRMPSKKN